MVTGENIDLMDLTVRELLEDYGLAYSPECMYVYGVISWDDAKRVWDTYDLEDCASFSVEPLINEESEIDEKPPLSWEIIEWIMENIGVDKKGDKNE